MKRFKDYIKEITNPILKNPNFKKWFGKSKVIDKSGNPLVVHHGTHAKFTVFDLKKVGHNYRDSSGGFFFTDRKDRATGYAKLHTQTYKGKGDGIVMGVYLNISKPYRDYAEDYYGAVEKFDRNSHTLTRNAILEGYDGIIIESPTGSLYVVFKPNQIKSATDNNGDFNPKSNDITE
jgi:hypothetical protein